MLRTKPDTAKTAPAQAWELEMDHFLVFSAEDPLHASLCRGEAEVREITDQFGCTAGLQVLRITMGEIVRDVTADFIADEYDVAEPEFTIRDHTRAMARSGAFGR